MQYSLQDITKIIFSAGGTHHLTFSPRHPPLSFSLYLCHIHALALFISLLSCTYSFSLAWIHLFLFICTLKPRWNPYHFGHIFVSLCPTVQLSFRSRSDTSVGVVPISDSLSYLYWSFFLHHSKSLSDLGDLCKYERVILVAIIVDTKQVKSAQSMAICSQGQADI